MALPKFDYIISNVVQPGVDSIPMRLVMASSILSGVSVTLFLR